MGPMGANGEGKEPRFKVLKNGSPATLGTDYLYEHETVNGVENWEIALLVSCTISFQRVGTVDLALVAGGQSGKTGGKASPDDEKYGGKGGAGGGITTGSGVSLQLRHDYAAVVGETDEDTEFDSYTAVSGAGSEGGKMWYSGGMKTSKGADGTVIWGGDHEIEDLQGVKFGAGGGVGGHVTGSYASYSGTSGGATGGGNGAGTGGGSGHPGQANTGSGGGGAYRNETWTPKDGTPGDGGSGIIIIRNHREV